jgi:DNA-binding NarL/FixJ family response regulator
MQYQSVSGSAAPVGPIGVLIADSNQTERQLLMGALRRHPEFHVVSCELETEAIARAAQPSAIQVAVINPHSPGGGHNDFSIVRKLHLSQPKIAQVVLLQDYDRDIVLTAFRSGAQGLFCLSNQPFRLLCKCIHCVYRGQIWANSEQLRYILEIVTQVPSLRAVNALGLKLLTPREEQVVSLVADGLSNREVAAELNISENTVKKYIFHIFEKLGISSRVELVAYALSHGTPRPAEWLAATDG